MLNKAVIKIQIESTLRHGDKSVEYSAFRCEAKLAVSLIIVRGSGRGTRQALALEAALSVLRVIDRFPASDKPGQVVFHGPAVDEHFNDRLVKLMFGWRGKNWKTRSSEPVHNSDLWQEFLAYVEKYRIVLRQSPIDIINNNQNQKRKRQKNEFVKNV